MKESTPAEEELARIYKRFYTALQLRDLCNEMPIYAVARKYDLPRGSVQNLAQTCHGFAAGMIKFCERMGWAALGAVLDHFSDRLKAGMIFPRHVYDEHSFADALPLQGQEQIFSRWQRSHTSNPAQHGSFGKTGTRALVP